MYINTFLIYPETREQPAEYGGTWVCAECETDDLDECQEICDSCENQTLVNGGSRG